MDIHSDDDSLSSDHEGLGLGNAQEVVKIYKSDSEVCESERRETDVETDRTENLLKSDKKPILLGWKLWEAMAMKSVDSLMREGVNLDSPNEILAETANPSPDFVMPLLRYQKEWLKWGLEQEKSDVRGGILADEMGMGKTVQAIALVLAKRERCRESAELATSSSTGLPCVKTTLVICPLIAVMQWVSEIDRFTTKGSNKVLAYHGPNRGKMLSEISGYDFIITTYSIVESEYRKKFKTPKESCECCGKKFYAKTLKIHVERCNADKTVQPSKQCKGKGKVGEKEDLCGEKDDKKKASKGLISFLHSVKWTRIILDEAHYIKDTHSSTAEAVFALQSFYKWALSGTPFQNHVRELYSLVRFLQIYPFSYYFCEECHCRELQYPTSSCPGCPHPSRRHFCWWTKISLRRDSLSIAEMNYYTSIKRESQGNFNRYVEEGTLMSNYGRIFNLITRLRQAADHPYLVMYPESAAASTSKEFCGLCHNVAEDPVVTSCEHLFCKPCLIEYSTSFGQPACPSCSEPLTVELSENNHDQETQKPKSSLKGFKSSSILNRICLENFQTSTKIEALKEEIRFMVERDGSAKGIVFSQFTLFLDLIHYSLQKSGVKCVQLDGSMTMAAREAAITRFTNEGDCRILLMSLKAGGVALNLTIASHVFMMDPWWNPAVEQQAQDRIYRIGQYKPIRVVRFVTENTIEEKILKLQEIRKLGFEGTVGGCNEALDKLNDSDLMDLFL